MEHRVICILVLMISNLYKTDPNIKVIDAIQLTKGPLIGAGDAGNVQYVGIYQV